MPLTGPEKAVLMLLSLDEATAAPIVAELDPGDLRRLREVAALMRAVPASAFQEVYGEFLERGRTAVAVPRGGEAYLRRLATSALGEEGAQKIFSDVKPSGLERISRVEPAAAATLLENEHPQIVAAVMSQMEPHRAAKILGQWPDERQAAVVARLASMTEVPAGLLEGVAQAIANELPAQEAEATMSVDGVTAAAGVLRKVNREASSAVLTKLEEQDQELSARVRQALCTFEDVAKLQPAALRIVFREVPPEKLVLALKVATEETRRRVYGSMSARAAELIRDDLEALGHVRLADVEAAQREIVDIALRLESEGTIVMGDDNDFV